MSTSFEEFDLRTESFIPLKYTLSTAFFVRTKCTVSVCQRKPSYVFCTGNGRQGTKKGYTTVK